MKSNVNRWKSIAIHWEYSGKRSKTTVKHSKHVAPQMLFQVLETVSWNNDIPGVSRDIAKVMPWKSLFQATVSKTCDRCRETIQNVDGLME